MSHQHQWRPTAHIDACHAFTDAFLCECGATATRMIERNPTLDSYSLIWMDDASGEPCPRCEELRNGAPVRFHLAVVAADGSVERETTEELPQEEE